MQISTVLRLTGRKLNHHRTTSSQRFHSFICNSIDFLFYPLLPSLSNFRNITPWREKQPFFPCSGKIKIVDSFVEGEPNPLFTTFISPPIRIPSIVPFEFFFPLLSLLFSNRAKISTQATQWQLATKILIKRVWSASRSIVTRVEFTASLVV